jgi:hypothetical protein
MGDAMPSTSRKPKPPATEPKPVTVDAEKDETEQQTMSRVLVGPYWRHGFVAKAIVDKSAGKIPGNPQFDDYGKAIKAKAEQAAKGDLVLVSDMLVAQAHSLDALFTELARRATLNMGEYVGATESYGRLALKAQANCRATLEALMKLHQPREQIVKHVHVNEGGQAVVADHFHAGGAENGENVKQSHATGRAGESPALPCPDPKGNGVPIPSREREPAVQDARRDESGGA